ncbi:magnesium transporter (plasmid) [Microvirga ossetica]|uniref:Magnesium transporter n=1 Tax=Microvirga ossetica TaxID=1882682 RepID=A0A1B2ESU4_9HYPH|nr:magnesium transporter CorA family protein [Microvirga ossetica]ANY83044.1 magnesium transporter [Microvirga ossetica]
MLTIYRDEAGSVRESASLELPSEVIWIDLLDPSDEEKTFVESRTHIQVPSIDALSEIEASSRLQVDRGVIYLSMPILARSDTPEAFLSPVGFILSPTVLVTVRFAKLSTFDQVAEQIHHDPSLATHVGVYTALLEAIVDRGADVLEGLRGELDQISHKVFRGNPTHRSHTVRSTDALRMTLGAVGAIGERVSQARDVLLGVGRIASFAGDIGEEWITPEFRVRLRAVLKDVASLNEYEAHLSGKVQFLLDAVLGYITIEQNDLFKVLTIASVVGIPPTLIAGLYGMNFKFMPELDWTWGYPFGLALILASALIPLIWFKWRGWF